MTTITPHALEIAIYPEEILDALRKLRNANHSAFLVGGLVRDLLLGQSGKDYDIATSARPEQVIKLFRRVIPTGIKHGTVTVLTKNYAIEVTTFRGEGLYVDGRRPESVAFLNNIVDDLARRDFTVNAMAYDPLSNSFVDPFGGLEDLAKRQIRCVGEARKRFSEDGLRPLRAVRFASTLEFEIVRGTREAIPATLDTFDKLANERVREELSKMLVGRHPGRALKLLQEVGLLGRVLPELLAALSASGSSSLELLSTRLGNSPADLGLRLASLLWDVPRSGVKRALERLRYPKQTIELVSSLLEHKQFGLLDYSDDIALRKAVSRAGKDRIAPLLELALAESKARQDSARQSAVAELSDRVKALLASHPPLSSADLAIDGKAIMKILGKPAGPEIGEAVRYLLELVLEDPTKNRIETLEQCLRER